VGLGAGAGEVTGEAPGEAAGAEDAFVVPEVELDGLPPPQATTVIAPNNAASGVRIFSFLSNRWTPGSMLVAAMRRSPSPCPAGHEFATTSRQCSREASDIDCALGA
jgi:hypothetical protein